MSAPPAGWLQAPLQFNRVENRSDVKELSHLRFLCVNYFINYSHNYGLHCNCNSLDNSRCEYTYLVHAIVHASKIAGVKAPLVCWNNFNSNMRENWWTLQWKLQTELFACVNVTKYNRRHLLLVATSGCNKAPGAILCKCQQTKIMLIKLFLPELMWWLSWKQG